MMRQKRLEARELRTQGVSVKEIALRLEIRKETASKWVRDIELTDLQVDELAVHSPRYRNGLKGAKVNQEKARKNREIFQQAGRAKAREGCLLHLKGCMLYWAEGAKSRHNVYLVNSDSNILYLFMLFLRQELSITDGKIGLSIHCHTQDAAEIARIEQYWLTTLGLPETALEKTQHKKGSDSRKNVLPNGLCGIRVSSVEIAQHIYGAIQEYCGFDNPEWLF